MQSTRAVACLLAGLFLMFPSIGAPTGARDDPGRVTDSTRRTRGCAVTYDEYGNQPGHRGHHGR